MSRRVGGRVSGPSSVRRTFKEHMLLVSTTFENGECEIGSLVAVNTVGSDSGEGEDVTGLESHLIAAASDCPTVCSSHIEALMADGLSDMDSSIHSCKYICWFRRVHGITVSGKSTWSSNFLL